MSDLVSNDVTILFCSCDTYSDLWENFFMLLKKYWPEYDGEIILNTESKEFSYEGLSISSPLNCSPDVSWSDRLSLSLRRVNTPYVLIFLDDFYLKHQVDHARFMETLEFVKQNSQVASITYLKEPGGRKAVSGLDGFVWRDHYSLYKMTAHITLYKVQYLQKVLKRNESAWAFEVSGTIRSWFEKGRFLCPENNENAIFSYDFGSLIIRGQYLKKVKEYFEAEGCIFDHKRPTIEDWASQHQGGFFVKCKYLISGLLSIFKKGAL